MNYQNNSENKDKSAQTPPSELVPNLFRGGGGQVPFLPPVFRFQLRMWILTR